MDEKAKQRAAAAERKRKSREKLKQFDIKVVEVKLSATERTDLAELCKVRGGVRGEYTADEYVALLIRRDKERLNAQLAELGCCGKCGGQAARRLRWPV
ncbi:hypothetical protein [Vibrio parahaemolyticus]|uniref:hypothetical protein n=1 Tax=Vibrio parahaemolyticus TaxID=670 RepID=UPI001D160F52|nr:hypothetical protein [Vibrio parahaemolyticus]MCC3836261.1 hypothetical protein [Vibrio parahaemolyticus]